MLRPVVIQLLFTLFLGCGVAQSQALQNSTAPYIVGGIDVAMGDFPFIVSLSKDGSHTCGGALLDAKTVVTAAHCVSGVQASSLKIRAGSLMWAAGGSQADVGSLTIHPGWNRQRKENDVALLHLAKDVDHNERIGYAKLPEPNSDLPPGSNTVIAGWGSITNVPPRSPEEASQNRPSSLMKVSLPVISRNVCENRYERIPNAFIREENFCQGTPAGAKTGACWGDSGGPIVDSSNTLIGLVSWGYRCADPQYPSVAVRLASYVRWIANNK